MSLFFIPSELREIGNTTRLQSLSSHIPVTGKFIQPPTLLKSHQICCSVFFSPPSAEFETISSPTCSILDLRKAGGEWLAISPETAIAPLAAAFVIQAAQKGQNGFPLSASQHASAPLHIHYCLHESPPANSFFAEIQLCEPPLYFSSFPLEKDERKCRFSQRS